MKDITTESSGFTLMEIISAVSIVSIGMLGMATLTYVASAYSYSLQEEFQAVSQAYRLEYELRRVVSLAVRVPINNANNRNGEISDSFKCISAFDGGPLNVRCPNRWKEVGVFFREDSGGTYNASIAGSRGIVPTAIWYRRPEHNEASPLLSTSGNVILKLGQWGDQNNANWSPEESDMYFDQLSSFSMDRVNDSRGVSRVDFEASFRYHGVSRIKTWCSYQDINQGRCAFGSNPVPNYYDNEYRFSIDLVNNMLDISVDDGKAVERRTQGSVHFFKMFGDIRN